MVLLTYQFCGILLHEAFAHRDEHLGRLCRRTFTVANRGHRDIQSYDFIPGWAAAKPLVWLKLVPFTLQLHVVDAFFFNVVAVVKASSVRQIHEQTHLHLDRDKNRGRGASSWDFQELSFPHSFSLRPWSHLLWDFLRSWTACSGETCSPLQPAHHIWDPAWFSWAGICLWAERNKQGTNLSCRTKPRPLLMRRIDHFVFAECCKAQSNTVSCFVHSCHDNHSLS